MQASLDPPLIPRSQLGLVAIAILAGMAVAAGVVLVLNWRHSTGPERSAMAERGGSGAYAKPSAFGNRSAPGSPVAALLRMTGAQIGEASKGSLVTVTGYGPDDEPLASGSGYIHSANGIIVTSYRLVRGIASLTVATAAGQELHMIATLASSPDSDLAILAVSESNLPALESDGGAAVQPDDRVFTASGMTGTVSGRRVIGHTDVIQTAWTMPVAPGSPVFNEYGRVIGVSTGAGTIPVRYIRELLAAKREHD